MEQLIISLSSLKNVYVGENLKIICKIINNLKSSGDIGDVKQLFSRLKPTSSLEKLIVIKLIDAFKLSDELIDAIVSEDVFIIAQSLKCGWFFKDEANYLEKPEGFVKEFFSKLSSSTRLKVLKCYGRKLADPGKANKFFMVVQNIYGIKAALKLLPVCSKDFILQVLNNPQIEVPHEVMDQLFIYHPQLTTDYIFMYYERAKESNHYPVTYERVLLKLASKNTLKFMELFNKSNHLNVGQLGKSLTRKLIKTDFPSILKYAEHYMRILNIKLVVPCLTNSQIEELNLALMPDSLKDFKSTHTSYYMYGPTFLQMYKYLNKNFAEELLLKNFQLKYGKHPLSVPNLVGNEFAEMLPKVERVKWAEMKLKEINLEDSDKARYASFLDPDKAFPLLKSLIPYALDQYKRKAIVGNMLKTLKINRSFSDLSEVFTFVIQRMKNDATPIKGLLLEEAASEFNLLQLSIDQWSPILELIKIMTVNDEISQYEYTLITLYQKWIHRRLMAGLPVDTELNKLLTLVGYGYTFSIASGTNYEHFCLSWFNENLENKKFSNDDQKKSMALQFFTVICKWNKKHPRNQLTHKEWTLDAVKEYMKDNYHRSNIVQTVKKHRQLKQYLYDNVFPEVCTPEILLYKLHYKIEDIMKNLDSVFEKIIGNQIGPLTYFFNLVRLYTTINLPDKFIALCVKTITSDDSDSTNKCNSIQILSLLMKPSEFLSFIEPFYPTNSTVDYEGDDAYNKLRIQTAVARNIKNVCQPSAMIVAIRKFTVGDFLKFAVGSLNSVLQKSSQEKALVFLSENMSSAVSFRKHVLRLLKIVAPRQIACDLLVQPLETEKNISIRVILLESISSILLEEKNEVAWLTLKKAFSYLNVDDIKQVKGLFQLRMVPKEYKSEYIMMVWEMLDRLKDGYDFRQKIFDLINSSTIILLNEDFCDVLLNLTYSSSEDYNWREFISLYLCYARPDTLSSRMLKVMSKLNSIFKDKWDVLDSDCTLGTQAKLSLVVESICSTSDSKDLICNPVEILSLLQTNLSSNFPVCDLITNNLLISLYCMYHKRNETDDLIQIASDICVLTDKECATYGPDMIYVFLPIIKNFIKYQIKLKEENNLVTFAKYILINETSRINKIMAVNILPRFNEIQDESEMVKFKDTITLLRQIEDPTLNVFAKYSLFK